MIIVLILHYLSLLFLIILIILSCIILSNQNNSQQKEELSLMNQQEGYSRIFPIELQQKTGNQREKAFTTIYQQKLWGKEHPNGFGSLNEFTKNDKMSLLYLIKKYNIQNIFDVPCGTYSWMHEVIDTTGIQYTGMDIVKEQVDTNRKKYPQHSFLHGDMTVSKFQSFDLIFSKEGTQHMTETSTLSFLERVQESKSKYLCLTHYDVSFNTDDTYDTINGIPDLESGAYREQNFLLPPYSLSAKMKLLDMFYIRNNIATKNSQYLLFFQVMN